MFKLKLLIIIAFIFIQCTGQTKANILKYPYGVIIPAQIENNNFIPESGYSIQNLLRQRRSVDSKCDVGYTMPILLVGDIKPNKISKKADTKQKKLRGNGSKSKLTPSTNGDIEFKKLTFTSFMEAMQFFVENYKSSRNLIGR